MVHDCTIKIQITSYLENVMRSYQYQMGTLLAAERHFHHFPTENPVKNGEINVDGPNVLLSIQEHSPDTGLIFSTFNFFILVIKMFNKGIKSYKTPLSEKQSSVLIVIKIRLVACFCIVNVVCLNKLYHI